METSAKILSVTAPLIAPVSTTASGDFKEGRAGQEAEQAARYRLIIEEGPTVGTYIYKTLDSATGEVVRQFPREEVLKLSESGGYAAGGLINISA